MPLRDGGDRARRVDGRGEGGRHIHHQDRVAGRIREQCVQRRTVPGCVGVARDIDGICPRPDRRQCRVELFHRLGREIGERTAEVHEAVHRQHADAAAIGQNRQALSAEGPHLPERFGGGEQLVEIEHAQQPRATERRLVDGVRAGERARVGGRRLGALAVTAGLDDDHGLHPRRGPRGRHELARIVDRTRCKAGSRGCRDRARRSRAGRRNRRRSGRRARRCRKIRPRVPRAHSTRPAAMAPDCEISARSPLRGICAAKLALSLARGASTPRQLGPTRRMPCARAACRAASASEPGP